MTIEYERLLKKFGKHDITFQLATYMKSPYNFKQLYRMTKSRLLKIAYNATFIPDDNIYGHKYIISDIDII